MGLLTDIYNTVAKFFRPQDGQVGEDPSKSVAQNRLKLVLMQDRTNLTPKVLEQMRGEMIDLLSKYLEMDKDLLELNFEQEGDQVALMLSIPVIRAKDEDEIEMANESESVDEDNNEDESQETEDDSEEIVDSEETSESKKRHSKVTTPEDLSDESESSGEVVENSEQQEVVCENSEC